MDAEDKDGASEILYCFVFEAWLVNFYNSVNIVGGNSPHQIQRQAVQKGSDRPMTCTGRCSREQNYN